jgi:hypothetical protein
MGLDGRIHVALVGKLDSNGASGLGYRIVGIIHLGRHARTVFLSNMHFNIFSIGGQVGIEQKGFPLELVRNSRSLAGFLQVPQADKAKGSDNVADNLDIDGFRNGRSSTHFVVVGNRKRECECCG